jgi:hypothetical protein
MTFQTAFADFVKKYTCIRIKYSNLEPLIQDVIDVVSNYVETEIDDEDRAYIIDSATTYEVLDEKNLYGTVMKLISGLNDNMFELAKEEGLFEMDNYDLDLQTDLSKLVYTYYFSEN